ncbi:hypothetical protein EKO27_g6652 [Xylaria grammica]|uniref:Carrier domain-containing protein n=1 Tax=Xylaria grammica TaxID=363999 RepID=A0A439D1Z0_9PEZI|nr:hypothetical protein EKO27_g6652 [Xylaria grammica]
MVYFTMANVDMAAVAQNYSFKETRDDRCLIHGIDWQQQLSLLTKNQLLNDFHCPGTISEYEKFMIRFYPKIESAMVLTVRKTLSQIESITREETKSPAYAQRFLSSLQRLYGTIPSRYDVIDPSQESNEERSRQSDDGMIRDSELEAIWRSCEEEHPSWKMFPVVARNLMSIIRCETDPIHLVFSEGLAEKLYASLFEQICDERFQRLLELLCHETSSLGILEGYLLFLEIIDPNTSCGNAGFGVFPGWWLSSEKERSNSPLISELQWDHVLQDAGFSGTDLVLRDFKSDVCHLSSIMLSRKVDGDDGIQMQNHIQDHSLQPQASNLGMILVVVNTESYYQWAVASMIERSEGHHWTVKTLPWPDAPNKEGISTIVSSVDDPSSLVIFLLEIEKPFLATITQEHFTALQELMPRASRLLWVTASDLDDVDYPRYSIVNGFLRSMRSESVNSRFVTISVEFSLSRARESIENRRLAEYIARIADACFPGHNSLSIPPYTDDEYTIGDDYIYTPRLVEETFLNKRLRRLESPTRREEAWSLGPPLKLGIGVPGSLDTFRFVQDTRFIGCSGIPPGDVEAKATVWPLSFRDLFVALGRLDYDILGLKCAGIITRIGSEVGSVRQNLKPGDKVCVGTLHGGMRTYVRESAKLVFKLPNTLSLEAAASSTNPGVTAYHGLINLARLQRSETILIHSTAGSTGQMAVWIAKMVGAEIFASVGNKEKKKLLIDEFNIPASHIFHSRDTSFLKGVKRLTGGIGVDVVFNSLSGEVLRASWECVAPFGRFIEIDKADIISNNQLPMGRFSRNVSFFSVDLHHIAAYNPDLLSSLMGSILDLLAKGVIHHPQPLHFYSVSEVEKAFRFMQTGRNTGRIVITPENQAPVTKLVRDQNLCTFDPNATYLIPGGLGGLGRAILRWMVHKGARNLIVPSRTGPPDSTTAAFKVVQEIRGQGVKVITPKCDVASITSLSRMLDDCSLTMPPIRGCINATMVLQDSIFENMTHAQWQLTIQSKAIVSWNLHQLLAVGSLDFFILLSSLSGIYGSLAQSNYAAGYTFQDALARKRASKGENAVSLDIGWMKTIGIIAETEEYQRNRENSGDMAAIEAEELLSLLRFADPTLGGRNRDKGDGPVNINDSDPADDSRQAASAKEKAEVVVRAVSTRLARALSIPVEKIKCDKVLSEFGIDSLMAVELRNWIGRDFRANLAVFDIMNGATILSIGDAVVGKSEV